MATKYYAVKVGLTPGVYKTWDECKNNTAGYPGAKFKKFDTEKEAWDFVNGVDSTKDNGVNLNEINAVIAYVDGSYDASTNRYSYGVAILNGEKETHLSGYGDEPDMASMRNVAGEILGATAAMEYALKNKIEHILIYHDYEGIAQWPVGTWKTNKEGTKAYREKYLEISKHIDIKFVKVKGHSNTFYNDVVDGLAKQAIGINSGIKKTIAEHIENIKNNN